MLNIFLGRAELPNYKVVAPADGNILEMTVHESVSKPD